MLVDQNDALARFSITVTDPRFRFQIRELTHGQLTARLGHTRLSQVHTHWPVEGRSLRIGAHNHEYGATARLADTSMCHDLHLRPGSGLWGADGEQPGRTVVEVQVSEVSQTSPWSEVQFEFHASTSAPDRIRTCAHGSGGGCCARA